MTKIFKSKNELFYFSKNSPVQEKGHFDVILSPEFYWVKKVELPVKKVSAAKRLAESVYEGSLPSGDFAYDVSKHNDAFIIVAYDKEGISAELSKKFIKDAKVSAVYFSQNEFLELEDCCGVDQYNSLINLEGLIMQVPRVCTESKKEIGAYLENKKLSNKKITLSSLESEVVGKKEVVVLATGMGLLLTSFGLDWFNYAQATKKLDDQRTEIITKYNLPQTSMQLNSIKKSLTKTFKAQKKIRDEVFGLNSLRLQKGEFIDRINASKSETVVVIKVESEARESQIKANLKSVTIKSSSFKDGYLTLKVAS